MIITNKQLRQIIRESLLEVMNPRTYLPKVRGGWTKDKIKRNINASQYGLMPAVRAIAEFDNVDEFRSHLFWHGSQYMQTRLKPSIKLRKDFIERYGGGGYGEQYWGISVTSDKREALRFSIGQGVNVHPIILLKGSKVINEENMTDAIDVEDVVEDLWNQGVDAIYIGDKNQGEKELLVLNPHAIVNIEGASEYFKFYGLDNSTVKNPTDEQLKDVLDTCKEYLANEYHREPNKPNKPTRPSRFIYNGNDFERDEHGNLKYNPNYDEETNEYNRNLENYNKKMDDYYRSDDYKNWYNRRQQLTNKLKFK